MRAKHRIAGTLSVILFARIACVGYSVASHGPRGLISCFAQVDRVGCPVASLGNYYRAGRAGEARRHAGQKKTARHAEAQRAKGLNVELGQQLFRLNFK